MNIIEELESRLAGEESMFRAQLLREDVVRLRRLVELADEHDDRDAFRKAGAYIGWTSGDMRTHELMNQLNPLLDAMFDYRRGEQGPDAEQTLRAAWDDFHSERIRILLHCL
jgi:hypothetical protein